MPNWDHVLREVRKEKDDPGGESATDKVRKKYLLELHNYVDRNIICYYSGYLSKPKIQGVEISDEDKNGFMLCIHKLDRTKGLDLFLHTPGGSGAATASLVDYLKQMFGNDIRAFVPQIAMSAGTIIACACREIYMGRHSNLGPVDPQINGLPAAGVLAELETAYQEMIADPRRQLVWHPILSRYNPSFVQRCKWAVDEAEIFVGKFLAENMFAHLPDADRDAAVLKVVKALTDLSKNKGHDKHLHYKECKEMGLNIKELEDPADRKLQDLVLTVHHCFMYTLANTPSYKIIENHLGRRYVKLQQEQQLLLMQQPAPIVTAPPATPAVQ